MTSRIIVAITALWLATLQAGWVSLVPLPDPIVMLPLAWVTLLVSESRRGEALLAAVVGGLVLDAVSSWPAGTNILLLVVGWLAADFLFHRVFTNQSLPAAAGLQAAVFLTWLISLSSFKAIRATLLGWGWIESGVWPNWQSILLSTACQVVLTVGYVWLQRRIYRRLGQGLMFTGPAERGFR